MFVVETSSGTVLHDCVPGTKKQDQSKGEPLSEEAAGKLASKANRAAEDIGISTRYEVVERP